MAKKVSLKDADIVVNGWLERFSRKTNDDVARDGEQAIDSDFEGEISTACLLVEKLLENGMWEYVGSIPVTEGMHLKETITEYDWGGPGRYKLRLADHDGNKVSGVKPISITIEGNEQEDPPQEEQPDYLDIDNEERRLKKAAAKIEELRHLRVQKELEREIREIDGEGKEPQTPQGPSLDEIKELIESSTKPETSNLIALMLHSQQQSHRESQQQFQQMQQSQQQMLTMLLGNKGDSPATELAKAFAPALPAIIEVLKPREPRTSPVEGIMAQILPVLLAKITEKPQPAPDPLTYIAPLLQATTATMQQGTQAVVENMNRVHEMQLQAQSGDTSLQRLQMISTMINQATKPIGDYLAMMMQNKIQQTPNQPQQQQIQRQAPAALPMPMPNPPTLTPEQEEERKMQMVVMQVTSSILAGKTPDEIYVELRREHPLDLLKKVANNQDLANTLLTIPEPYKTSVEKIINAIKRD